MKFVCDKCKTRYSIGEDRVRGKILKIRCKNCANVITVREGMDAGGGEEPARSKPITAAPPVGSIANAKAVAPPPPSIQEEWYVSIDGVQSGPLSLANAKKWVAAKPFEADLHCWSEGFDDWLSVDKVSHFRDLRKPRAPQRPKTIPPPIPPKPLFAATMAAIEKEASGPVSAKKSGPIPALPSSGPMAARSGPIPAIPSVKPALPGPGVASRVNGSATASSSMNRMNALKGSGAAGLGNAFDSDDLADARTSLGAPAFDFGASSAPAHQVPEPNIDPFGAFDAKQKPTVKQALESDDEDDGLSIGEVSRVVKLADLAPKPARQSTAGANTASVQRIGAYTASQPKLSPTELGMNVSPALVAEAGPMPDESVVARSFAQRHRRGLVALIGFAGLLVAGVIGLVFYVTSKQTDDAGDGLGGTRVIDTSRPEDIVRRQLPPTPGTGSATTPVTQRPRTVQRPAGGSNTPTQVEDDPKGGSLKSSEIEDMAAKQGEGTKRCYMRAQKGALGFEIADLKKIAVTLTVGKDGVVSDVQLSSHATDAFGTCLIARIKAWHFRESSGGIYRISLAFSN